MRSVTYALLILAALSLSAQEAQLKTAAAVLDRYKQALGGEEAIAKVKSETVHGEIQGAGVSGKMTFVYYAKPFKTLMKITAPDSKEFFRDSTARFHGASHRKAQASTKTRPSKPSAATLICNIPFINRTISTSWNSPASPISKATSAIGCTAPRTGAKTTTSSTT